MSDLPNMAISEKSVHRELSLDSVFTSNATSDLGYNDQTSSSQAIDPNFTESKLDTFVVDEHISEKEVDFSGKASEERFVQSDK